MIKSLTGFGASSQVVEKYLITVEVKSLNAKFIDINLRIPPSLNSTEFELKKIIAAQLIRGKITASIDITTTQPEDFSFNIKEFEKNFNLFESLGRAKNIDNKTLFTLATKATTSSKGNSISKPIVFEDNVKDSMIQTIKKAVTACSLFRVQEGETLGKKIKDYTASIKKNLKEIEKLDTYTSEKSANRIKKALTNSDIEINIDKNRFEQELIYYIEKLSIDEEKVRLANHLSYFEQVLTFDEPIGKKLGFLAQEIGREINTIGSKTNNFEVQKHVVIMKEELEKIKEQSLNIL